MKKKNNAFMTVAQHVITNGLVKYENTVPAVQLMLYLLAVNLELADEPIPQTEMDEILSFMTALSAIIPVLGCPIGSQVGHPGSELTFMDHTMDIRAEIKKASTNDKELLSAAEEIVDWLEHYLRPYSDCLL